MKKDKIYVTRPFLPPLEEFLKYLEKIWDSKWLTNNGQFHREFEEKLAEYLGVKYVSLFVNGTLALIVALQVLRISGDVITTPYSFVATTHSLFWNSITPVFVDIDPKTFNIDPEKIEAAITPKTTAILPVHVYGNPCDVDRIRELADIYGLRVIYDAAHAFGVEVKEKSIVHYGDLSVLSFHATKVFTTFEGGAIISHDEKTKRRIDFLKNFGFANETTVVQPGINAKMNEFQSALGLLQLKYFEKNIEDRKKIAKYYRKRLKGVKGIRFLDDINRVKHNYAYFPILVEKDYSLPRDELYQRLKDKGFYVRRYFYPLINEFSPYRSLQSATRKNLKNAYEISEKILCLPVYSGLKREEQDGLLELLESYS
jgi:dTDP-4-amino-4,6-dideoxygalactose transaminase